MDSALDIHRLHFAFTITFHYLFPQLVSGRSGLVHGLLYRHAHEDPSSTT